MEAKTSVRDFSLLKDGKFRVNFDCYKARPHFIIALDDSPKTVYEDLSDDQKKKVINLALQGWSLNTFSGNQGLFCPSTVDTGTIRRITIMLIFV